MAELALSLVGGVGVLGQIFQGCISAYRLFTTASNISRDSEKLITKIRIEEMRLTVWGREWGVEEGKLETYLKDEGPAGSGNDKMKELAVQILSELLKTITDLEKLKGQYGFREEAGSSEEAPPQYCEKAEDALTMAPSKSKAKKIGAKETWKEASASLSFTHRIKTEVTLRAKWVIADKDKFGVFLCDLKDYNDGLEQLFPRTRLATLHRSWQNELLSTAHRDLKQLHLLESASNGVYPQLTTCASLKQLRVNLDSKPDHNFKPTYALKVRTDLLKVLDKDKRRSLGNYDNPSRARGENVVIEWVAYDREDVDARFAHMRRIDDLARMVHSASDRHPDLHTVDCLGYFDDSDHHRYGVVYSTPQPSFMTLQDYISSSDYRTPDLGERVKLAHTLAVALWSFHSLDWLHKSVCAANVLFFPVPAETSQTSTSSGASKKSSSATETPDISSPYLLGFDASRPEQLSELSSITKNPSSLDLHRHPLSLDGSEKRPFCKAFDIYSLGLLLLEIGLWRSLQSYYKPHYSAQKFKERIVLGALVPGLASKIGRRYMAVVEKCLNHQENEEEEAHRFMEEVVGMLEGIRV